MADLKISQLTDGGASQATDEYVVARSGSNFRIDGASVAAAATSVGTLTSLTVSGTTTFGANLLSSSATAFIGANTSDGADSATVTISGGGGGDSTRGAYVSMAGNENASAGNIEIASGNVAGSSLNLVARSATSPMLFYSGGTTERMRLDASGNLALGTTAALGTAPGYNTFTVSGSTGGQITLGTGTSVKAFLYNDSTNDLHFGAVGAGAIRFYTSTEKMRLDASGNLGLGVTPSAWSGFTALQIKNASFASYGSSSATVSQNLWFDGSAWKFIANGYGTQLDQYNGIFQWYTAGNNTSGANATATLTERMRLDASGNLGVGTTSPNLSGGATGSQIVTVSASASGRNGILELNGTRTTSGDYVGYVRFFNNAGATPLADIQAIRGSSDTTGVLAFATGNTERARITSGGYFKASNTGAYNGATAAYHELRSDANATTARVQNLITSGYTDAQLQITFIGYTPNATNAWFLFCDDPTNQKAGILSTGTFESRTSTYGGVSDVKLKQDIVDAASQWDDLKAVRVRKFRFKDEPDSPLSLGVVAQELEQVSPGLVYETPDYEEQEVTDEDGNVTTEKVQVGTTKSVKYSILYMKAVKALQEAMARIEALEARLEALEA